MALLLKMLILLLMKKTKADIGLFSEFKGVMEKISFKDFNFYIDNEQSLFIGGIVG